MKIYFETGVDAPFQRVAEGFDEDLFRALKPPIMHLDVLRFDGCHKGDVVELSMGLGPLRQSWVSHITYDHTTADDMVFIDEGHKLPPPLRSWHHTHKVIRQSSTQTTIVDDIRYSTGFKVLDALIYPVMYLMFIGRKPIYKRYFKA